MRIVLISDTHGRHEDLGTLAGDVLIHCGDVEDMFQQDNRALARVDDWFGRQGFQHILCIGGNHDLALERQVHRPFRNATYLLDTAFEIDGVKFYGAPWVPQLDTHAFFADEDALQAAWARIPDDVDVLITHTAPAGVLDVSSSGLALGCPHLARRVRQIKPALHAFGHVHASAGRQVKAGVTYVNASSVGSDMQITNPPVVFDFKPGSRASWWPFRAR